ncbi:hypothetical protein GCM10012284_65270 [Mangrovihabitans endophyticus]|uniref:Uncharacterized protein n=1 Tax=Mangrovihabitans endophyticus TaxID=1751298 RepID=A0A8J3C5F3_9ACTN|nr:hypothetical protein GCM10012284_65270 [Mangrovihabitans endophyticus]
MKGSSEKLDRFPCASCGLCCKNITGIVELVEFDAGNGVCKFLDLETKKCQIYSVRPKQCQTFPFWEGVKTFSKEQKEAFCQSCPGITQKTKETKVC